MKLIRLRRRIASLILTGVMISQAGIGSADAISTQHWASGYINELMKIEKLRDDLNKSGIPGNPDKPVSKKEFIALLTALINKGNVYNAGIGDLHKANSEKYITREEAVAIAGQLCRLESHNEVKFPDKDNISQDAYTYIAAFSEQGIISGYTDGRFIPRNNLTGAQAAVITDKLIQKGFIAESNVSDFAGGAAGFKDSTALQAGFLRPVGLCDDGNGGIIVVDSYNSLIRRISDQKVETVAGKLPEALDNYKIPIGGYRNGEEKQALFNKPQYCTVNAAGDLIVSDTENNSIRLVSDNNVTSLNSGTAAGYQDGKLVSALFNKPSDIVADKSGNVYIADTLNNCIRYIDIKNGEVSTLAGKPAPGLIDGPAETALFNQPVGLAIDKNGVLYVSDSGNQRIRKIEKGIVSTLAGSGDNLLEETNYIEGGYCDGETDKAKFNFPGGIDVNEDGIVFVADTGNHRIRAITKTKVITIAGNGEAAYVSGMARASSFNEPSDVLVSGSRLFISDSFNSRIRLLDIDTQLLKD